ncbi:MAG: AAA family ATPase [Deltaproteobacteria bacterium]|nr:AAA family ATPase [Deltaproteobacteria bacterium]
MSEFAPIARELLLLRTALSGGRRGLVAGSELLDKIVVAALAREHVLVVGPPGTGRGAAAARAAQLLDGRHFEYMLSSDVEGLEVFGPIEPSERHSSLAGYGLLADTDVAFLDGIFDAPTVLINQIAWLLSAGVLRRGGAERPGRLRVCVGACSELPKDDARRAFEEQLLVRHFAGEIPENSLHSIWAEQREWQSQTPVVLGLHALDTLSRFVCEYELSAELAAAFADEVYAIRSAGVVLSAERASRARRVVIAKALIDGAERVELRHLQAISWVLRTADDLARVRGGRVDDEGAANRQAIKPARPSIAAYSLDLGAIAAAKASATAIYDAGAFQQVARASQTSNASPSAKSSRPPKTRDSVAPKRQAPRESPTQPRPQNAAFLIQIATLLDEGRALLATPTPSETLKFKRWRTTAEAWLQTVGALGPQGQSHAQLQVLASTLRDALAELSRRPSRRSLRPRQ